MVKSCFGKVSWGRLKIKQKEIGKVKVSIFQSSLGQQAFLNVFSGRAVTEEKLPHDFSKQGLETIF